MGACSMSTLLPPKLACKKNFEPLVPPKLACKIKKAELMKVRLKLRCPSPRPGTSLHRGKPSPEQLKNTSRVLGIPLEKLAGWLRQHQQASLLTICAAISYSTVQH